jgi:hypothetical protein
VDEQACDKPKRHRTEDIPGLIVVDAVTFILIIVRIAARYRTIGQMEMDDWVVVALFPFLMAFMIIGNYGT